MSGDSLRRNCESNQIAQLAHNITMGWKALVEEIRRATQDVAGPRNVGDGQTSSVKNQNIRKRGQEEGDFNKAGSLANTNWRPNANQHKGIVTPDVSSNTNLRTTPAIEVASRKFEKGRMLQPRGSNGSVAGRKTRLASREDIKCWNEVVADVKYEATKRKMQGVLSKNRNGQKVADNAGIGSVRCPKDDSES